MNNRSSVFSDIATDLPDPNRIGLVVIGMADATPDDWLKTAAATLAEVQKEWSKDVKVIIAYSGYDEDPRQLWEIEEAKRKLSTFSMALWNAGFPKERFDNDTNMLLMACTIPANHIAG
jgi:hypothetical protein